MSGQDIPHSVVPGRFVGRAGPLRELQDLAGRALRGETVLVLITGEPGIGKTSLAQEIAHREERFSTAIWGHCWGDDGAPPYAPWIDALEALDAQASTPSAHLVRSEKARDRELAAVETDRILHQWVVTLRKVIDDAETCMLVFDDLHAADLLSVKLLERLSRTSGKRGVLLLATARTREVQSDPNRREVFGKLLRTGHHFPLGGLSDLEISELYSATTGKPSPSAEDLRKIGSLTARNPFLIREVIRHSETAGGGIPTGPGVSLGTRIFLQERLSSLSHESRKLAVFLAVFGTNFPLPVVSRWSAGDSRQGLKLLGEIEAAGIVERAGKSGAEYRFTHDLFREAMCEELTTDVRHASHLEIAEQLIPYASGNVADVSLIAFHLKEALPLGDPAVTGQWARKAANARMDAAGASDAIEWLTLALECDRLGHEDMADSPALRKALAEAHALAGQDDAAQSILYALVEELWESGRSEAVAEATLLLAHLSPAQPNLESRIMKLIQRALAGIGKEHDTLRAGLLARSSTLLYFDDLAQCRALADEAFLAAKDCGDGVVLCHAMMALRTAQWGPDATDKQVALSLDCLHAAKACDEYSYRFTAFHWIACDMLSRGTRLGIEKLMGDWRKEAARAVDRRPSTLIGMIEATRDFMAGRFLEAAKRTEKLQAELEDLPVSEIENLYQFLGVQLFSLQREKGELAQLEASVLGFAEQYPGLYIWQSGLALLFAETNRPKEAFQILENLAEHSFEGIPRDGNWLATIANCAEVASACGATSEARTLHALLQPARDLHVVLGMGASCWGSVHHYLGLLEECLGRHDEAVLSFQRAIVANEAADAAGLAAYGRAKLAGLLRRKTDTRQRAEELLAEAVGFARQSGSIRLLALVEAIQETSAPDPSAPTQPVPKERRQARFTRQGDYWLIAMDGAEARLRDRRGLRQLWQLLSSPGVYFLALEILEAPGGEAPPGIGVAAAPSVFQYQHEDTILDSKAIKEFKARLEMIEEELVAAEKTNDLGRLEVLHSEKASLVDTLKSATGLGGRKRRTTSPAEKARVNVTRTLRSALNAITEQAPSLGAYLDRHVETGRTCRYEPDSIAPIEFDLF